MGAVGFFICTDLPKLFCYCFCILLPPAAPFLTRQKWGKERLGEGISIPFPQPPFPTTKGKTSRFSLMESFSGEVESASVFLGTFARRVNAYKDSAPIRR